MKCSDLQRFLDTYLDGEFEPREQAEFDAHLSACETCQKSVEIERRLLQSLKECTVASAPTHLKACILEGLNGVDQHRGTTGARWRHWSGWRSVSVGAVGLVLVGLTLAGTLPKTDADGSRIIGDLGAALAKANATQTEAVVEETLDWHRRRLPVEVTGPRREDVVHWFEGKVDFPVSIPRFDEKKVDLLGGRLAKVGDHKAALVTLQVNHRKLTLLMFPRVGVLPPGHSMMPSPGFVEVRAKSGYHVAIFQRGDIAYSLASDLSERELRHLAATLETR